MIELGELFNRCIPVDTLLQFPRKFVIRLRELRRIQKEHQAKQQYSQMNSINTQNTNNAHQMFNSTAIDELVDELS